MKKKLYDILFPKKVDERIDVGSVIRLEAYTEYVVLGFEVCDWYCNVVAVKRDNYLQANPLLHKCSVDSEKITFIEQLDKNETLAYYTKLKLMGLDLNLETRKQIKEQSKDILCKRRLDIDFSGLGGTFIVISIITLFTMLIGRLIIAKTLFLLFVSILCIVMGILLFFISILILSCDISIRWERIY